MELKSGMIIRHPNYGNSLLYLDPQQCYPGQYNTGKYWNVVEVEELEDGTYFEESTDIGHIDSIKHAQEAVFIAIAYETRVIHHDKSATAGYKLAKRNEVIKRIKGKLTAEEIEALGI